MKRYLITSFLFLMSFTMMHSQTLKTGIVAHRGFWNCEEGGYAKNSLAALKAAQDHGFWGSEFDVNMTADSVLIVYHDSSIDNKRIEKYPYSEFSDFRIANGERIPTIDEYLEQGEKSSETILIYELKPHSSIEVEDTFINLTIAKLKEHDLLKPDRVMFISFSFHICSKIAEMLPGFTVQYLGRNKNPHEVSAAGISGIDFHHLLFSAHPQWIREARAKGLSINVWTVNNRNNIVNMLKMGVDQITTDMPLTVREIMKEIGIEEER